MFCFPATTHATGKSCRFKQMFAVDLVFLESMPGFVPRQERISLPRTVTYIARVLASEGRAVVVNNWLFDIHLWSGASVRYKHYVKHVVMMDLVEEIIKSVHISPC